MLSVLPLRSGDAAVQDEGSFEVIVFRFLNAFRAGSVGKPIRLAIVKRINLSEPLLSS
jgi:hypothetical protein